MSNEGSKDHIVSITGLRAANSTIPSGASAPNDDDPYVLDMLGVIVSAFVDLGFGVAAAQQARKVANDNRDLIRLAADFPTQSS